MSITEISFRSASSSSSEFDTTPLKKRRITPADLSKFSAKISFDGDFERAQRNYVLLSRSLYTKVFGRDSEDGCLLKVANLVFPAYKCRSLSGDCVDMNFMIRRQVNRFSFVDNDCEKIWISPFNLEENSPSLIKKIRFVVLPSDSLNVIGDSTNVKPILTSSLVKLIKENFDLEILKYEQELFLNHPVLGPLKIIVERWENESTSFYGFLSSETEIKLMTGNPNLIILVDEVDASQVERFHFTVTSVNDLSQTVLSSGHKGSPFHAWKKGTKPLPLLFPFTELCHRIKSVFRDKTIVLDHTEHFCRDGWRYDVKFSKVEVKKSEEDSIDTEEENKKAFNFDENRPMRITVGNEIIMTNDFDKARVATELTFEITDMDRDKKLKNNEITWVSIEQITEALKQQNEPLAHEGLSVVRIGKNRYLLKLINVTGEPIENEQENGSVSDIWRLDENTRVNVYAKLVKVEIVDTPNPISLEKIKVKVMTPDASVKALRMLRGEDEEGGDNLVLDESELEHLFKNAIQEEGIVHNDQLIHTISRKGNVIKFKLENLNQQTKEESRSINGDLYRILPSTQITFVGDEKSDLLISSKPVEISVEDLEAKLFEFGIGGMKEKFKEIIGFTQLSRSIYSGHVKKLGIQPSRGMLLWGPPGTGKTLIARKFGELLGVTEDRVILISGSQIWDKYAGESEKKVRKIFKKPRAAWKKFGKKSPLFLVVIDEIDAFLRGRTSDSKSWETSVVTAFLSELDGISSKGGDSLSNVIVVGLTNHPDQLDQAVVRPGRLYPHIHIGIPDQEGRKQIFEIHSRKIQENGFLAGDVDVSEIVKLTVGRTGAFIEGMVVAATGYSLKRLWENKVPLEELQDHPMGKIGMEDFKKAYQDCSIIDEKKNKEISRFIPSSEIEIQQIIEDLKSLGLVGLNEEVIKFLYDLKLSQHYREYLSQVNISFPRGVLLYGAPGTGKTTLAKNVKKLFGLDDQRFHYLKASELWVGDVEKFHKEIKERIAEVKTVSDDLKGEAYLQVLVIDDIDFMYPRRESADTQHLSVMNRVMAELEPLFGEEKNEINNFLVIGVAHRNILGLPEDIVRYGRLGRHVEVKLPKLQERKEIFSYYLMPHIDKKLLDPDVEIDDLAGMTKDYNGAYIEGLVNNAVFLSTRRMHETSEVGLKMEDFKDAHKEMRKDPKWFGYTL